MSYLILLLENRASLQLLHLIERKTRSIQLKEREARAPAGVPV